MEFNKNCDRCGDAYIAYSANSKYCATCRKIVNRDLDNAKKARQRSAYAKAKEKKREKPKESITEVASKALAAGMTYGQYVAKYGEVEK